MKDITKCDMTKGNPVSLILAFSIPMLIGNIFQQFYNMVDSAVVGKFVGPEALAAVGSTGNITFLFFSLVFGLASGIGIIVSQYYGAKEEEKVKQSIATSFYLMVISSLAMGFLTIFAARPVLTLLNTPDEVMDAAVIYLQIAGTGVLAIGIYNGVSAILRALGDSFTPLIFLVISCAVNIILDLVFVIVFKWGVFGVSLATVIAQVISAIGILLWAIYKNPVFRMPLKDYVINKEILKKSIKVGVPVALQSALIAISCLVLQGVVNGYGAVIMAAYTVACRFEQLVQQPFNSMGVAIGVYTGQNMGAADIERIKKGFWAGTKIGIIFSLMMLPVTLFGGEAIMKLFTDDPAVIAEGARGIRINCFFYSALAMIYVTRNILNGTGDVRFTMLSGVIEVVSRVCLAKPLTYIPFIGMLSIWFTSGFTWVITGGISCLRYASGKWKNMGIVDKEYINNQVPASEKLVYEK